MKKTLVLSELAYAKEVLNDLLTKGKYLDAIHAHAVEIEPQLRSALYYLDSAINLVKEPKKE